MLLVNSPMGYTVCLECHAVDRESSRDWAEAHANHDAERERSKRRHPARRRTLSLCDQIPTR